MSDNECRDQLERTCQSIVDEMEFCATHDGQSWEDIDPDDIPEGIDEDDVTNDDGFVSLYDYCADALSIEVYGKRSAGDSDWTMTHVTVVFETGGPHVEFTTEQSSYVEGRWGSDRVSRYVGCDVGALVEEMFGEDL
jgi:hypothetical protein